LCPEANKPPIEAHYDARGSYSHSEHAFVYREPTMSRREQMTVRAADLAERIVDEISQSDQNWRAIERHARKLVELVALQADRQGTPT
jgi:hypothetical protein